MARRILVVTVLVLLLAGQALAQRPGIVKSRDSLMDAAYDDQVYVDEKVLTYLVDLVFATRQPGEAGLDDLEPLWRAFSVEID